MKSTVDYINTKEFKSPFGELIIGSYGNKLCLCDWKYRKMRNQIDERIQQNIGFKYVSKDSNIIDKTIVQLSEYFEGKREEFNLPLLMIGSDFQKKVWQELMSIPIGKTKSYLELAEKLGDKKAVRAVASANGANALAIVIPCHRIVGSDNSLTGYAGGLSTKSQLLKLEGFYKNQHQLDLFNFN